MAHVFVADLQRLCILCAFSSSAFDTRVSVSSADQRFPRCPIFTQARFLLTLLLIVSPSLFAQTTSGILGTVTDQQGLPIAGAEIAARSKATGSETKPITDSDGNFALLGLQVEQPEARTRPV